MKTSTIDQILESNIHKTLDNETRKSQVSELSSKIEILRNLVHDYSNIDNVDYDTDDEIINWTFVDVISDLISAQANFVIGHYKASASLMRNAQELAFTALFFQLKQNEIQNRHIQYNSHFSEWDSGLKDSPNWGTTRPVIAKNKNVKYLINSLNIDILDDAYSLYKELCAYTHNRAFDPNSNPVTNINMYKENFMGFEEDLFNRFLDLFENTISSIATVWLISFPEIYMVDPLWCESELKLEKLDSIIKGPSKSDIINFLRNVSSN